MPKMLHSIPFHVGDSVRVKEGVEDPDNPEWDIVAWQGRIVEVGTKEPMTILVEWDSITLDNMPAAIVEQCEKEGLDWSKFDFFPSHLEKASPRDTEEDVKQAQNKLHDRYCWVSMGEEGERIRQVLAGVDLADEMGVLNAWQAYLSENLTFPFEAEIAEFQEYGRLRQGDKVHVVGIVEVGDHYGPIAEIRHARRRYDLPLADLEACDSGSPNYQPLRAYRFWFANR
jgi:hypothetical protein